MSQESLEDFIARLRVGGEHAERALEFYEPVGAVRRIREARSLLAKRA
jgi:hypothetical protein